MNPTAGLRRLAHLVSLVFLGTSACFAAKVETRTIRSASMNKDINVTVVVPDSYSASSGLYPTVYLLHGYSDDYTSWVKKMPVTASLADRYSVILVCPDGGYDSWYWDSPVDPAYKYETHITKEVIPFVDENFRTLKDRHGRAITGLSMGGHGALYLAFRHQDLFGAAGSTSGGVDIRPFPGNWGMAKWLGDYATDPDNWESHTVMNQLHLLKKDSLSLIIDCGLQDFFHGVNQRLHEELVYRNIPHDYIERPGSHEHAYWNVAIDYQLLFFRKYFDRSAASASSTP